MLKAIVLDIDGVVLLGKTPIPGAEKAVQELRKKYKIFFLSNNSNRSRRTLVEKLKGAGITAYPEESYPASYGTADYISKKYPRASACVISGGGLQEELKLKGLRISEGDKADVVAVGFDPKMQYSDLTRAFRAILDGAEFIASNEDKTFPVEDGLKPGAGATVAALQFSTGKKPKVVGKPQTYMLEMIMREHNLKRSELLVVGDRFDIDMQMARKAGIGSALVLTGVAKRKDLKNGRPKPDFVLDSISQLPQRLKI